MELLVCPVCRAELDLTATESDVDTGEIVEGALHCPKCPETYPISAGIPDLLPPDQRA
jgi:uncharacterized protein YbaR (Trm112 family)